MNEQMHRNANQDIEINFAELAVVAWKGRWIILAVTALTVAVTIGATLFTAKYESEGFFQFGGTIPIKEEKDRVQEGQFIQSSQWEERERKSSNSDKKKDEDGIGIALADYKRLASSIPTFGRFSEYVESQKLEAAPGVAELRRLFLSRDGIGKSVQPVYTFTQLDAKQLVAPTDNKNDVIGLQIASANSKPEVAQAMAGILGRYAMDSIIYSIYSDSLLFKNSELAARLTKLDNEIIQGTEKLEEYLRKGQALKKIIADHPGAAEVRTQQVISVTSDSVRYLSPVTQLVSTEVQISDMQERIRKIHREKQQMLLLAAYYAEAKKILESTKSGEALLRGMEIAKGKVFEGKNLQDDVVKEVYNRITIDNQTATNVYLENSRFVAGPILPASSSARPVLAAAGGLMAGLLLSLVIVFGRNWLLATKNESATSPFN